MEVKENRRCKKRSGIRKDFVQKVTFNMDLERKLEPCVG